MKKLLKIGNTEKRSSDESLARSLVILIIRTQYANIMRTILIRKWQGTSYPVHFWKGPKSDGSL